MKALPLECGRSVASLSVFTGEMPRLPRIVVPGAPHHVTQRGNRKQRTFFQASDYFIYRSLMREQCRRRDVEIWAYCLMPNHVHWMLSPATSSGLARAVGEAHRRYTLMVNRRMGWKGYLWQGRFASFPMEETHLYHGARYILMNPVRAGLVERAEEWPFSSARAHLKGQSDGIIELGHLAGLVDDWTTFLGEDLDTEHADRLRLHQRTGRPLGSEAFLRRVEANAGRALVARRTRRRDT